MVLAWVSNEIRIKRLYTYPLRFHSTSSTDNMLWDSPLRVDYIKLLKWNLGCIRNPKILEMSESWDICQGELHTGSGTSPRGRHCRQETWMSGHLSPMKLKSRTPGINGPIEFGFFLISFIIFSYSPLWNSNVYSVLLWLGNVNKNPWKEAVSG